MSDLLSLLPEEGVDAAAALNQWQGGWTGAMGLHFVRATADEVVAEIAVGPQHLQAYGIVHGAVHAGLIETAASVGAALAARSRRQAVVGLENHTSFVSAVRGGVLRATARPVTRGRRSQLWDVVVTAVGEAGPDKVAATGRVRLLALEPEAPLAGEEVRLRGDLRATAGAAAASTGEPPTGDG